VAPDSSQLRSGVDARRIVPICLATWIVLTVVLCGLAASSSSHPSAWVGQHGGSLFAGVLVCAFAGAASAMFRNWRLGVGLVLAEVAAYLSFAVLTIYALSTAGWD